MGAKTEQDLEQEAIDALLTGIATLAKKAANQGSSSGVEACANGAQALAEAFSLLSFPNRSAH